MVTTKFAGKDIVLSIGDTPVGQVITLGEAGSSRNLIDASAYGDDWKDYVVGQQDGDEVAIEIAYDPDDSQHGSLVTAYNDTSITNFEMDHADADFHVGFPALITKLSRGGTKDGLLHMLLTLKILNPGVEDLGS